MSTDHPLPTYGLYIDGAEVPPASGAHFPTEDPYTNQPWAQIARANVDDVNRAVASARAALAAPAWRGLTATQRGRLMRRLGDLVAEHAEHLGEIERRDNGKLAAEVTPQMRYVGEYIHYYAGLADKVQGDVIPSDKPGVFAYTRLEPKGLVVIITPWNSPLALTTWKLAPALAAGCTVVVKPSEYTSASMIEFARLVTQAGFPPGVVNVVTGFGAEIGEALVTHPDVAHIGFTGGEAAGRKIYELAARSFKTVTLELGGKSPNIVFDDADLDNAVKGVVAGIFAAAGQTCIAGSRLLVQRGIHDVFVQRLVEFMRDATLGDPALPATQIGPIATKPQFEKIVGYLEIAKAEGARCVLGGEPWHAPAGGLFIRPTIFTGVHNRMRIAQEEVFGPVLAVIPFDDLDDAVAIANDIPYGLAAGVWTRDLHRALAMSERLEAGTVWVNNYRSTSFTSPFGGYKRSGVGRESGTDAIREYLHTKCVWMSSDLPVANPFGRR